MSDEDLQEIETLSKNMLKEMGYDPETLQPVKPTAPTPPPPQDRFPQPAKIEQPTPTIIEPQPSKVTLATVPALLRSLIDHLTVVRTKAATTDQSRDRRLQQLLSDLNLLIYDLKVIDKPHHHKRLALPEFDRLRTTLSRLDAALTAATAQLSSTPEDELYESPYTLLSLDPTATQEEIEAAYLSVQEQIGPDAVRERATKEGLEPKDIKRAVKEAELNFEFVTDAYEKIKDPESRAIIDKEREAHVMKKEIGTRTSKQALDKATSALNYAIFENLLLNELDTFLKKYEPAELEMRKRMEEEEAKRREEHKLFSERPLRAETKPLHIKSTEGRGRFDYGGRYDYPGARAGYSPPYYGGPSDYSGSTPQAGGPGAGHKGSGGGHGGGRKPGAPHDGKKEQDKKEKADEDKDDKEGKEKTGSAPAAAPGTKGNGQGEPDPFTYKLGDLEQELHTFNKHFDKNFFDQIAANKIKPEDLSRTLTQFNESTGLNELAEKLDYIQEKMKSTKDRKEKQYKTILGGIDQKLKTFKDNVTLAQKALQHSEKSLTQLAKEQAKAEQAETKTPTEAGTPEGEIPETPETPPSGQEVRGMVKDLSAMLEAASKNANYLSQIAEAAKKPSAEKKKTGTLAFKPGPKAARSFKKR